MDAALYNKLISSIPLFKNLTPGELDKIVKISKLVKVKKGTTIIKEGAPGTAMYMLVQGKARVLKDIPDSEEKTLMADIEAPSVVGEMALIDGSPRSASVATLTDCVLMCVEQGNFNRLRRAYDPAAFKVIRELAFTLCERLEQKTALVVQFFESPEKHFGRLEQLFLQKKLPS